MWESNKTNLCHKHGSWWDFHVSSKLQISKESQRLRHAYVSVSLEAYVSNRSLWISIPNDVFRDNIQTRSLQQNKTRFSHHNRFNMYVFLSSNLISSGLDHANERSEEDSYQTSQESSPPRKLNLRLIVKTHEDNNCNIHRENRKEPPERNFFVIPFHYFCMYIHFLVSTKHSFGLVPKIFTVEKQYMDNTSSQGGET